jgi:NitT/TauT family transport system substrate-binding protein
LLLAAIVTRAAEAGSPAAAPEKTARPLKPASVVLLWHHQAQFAGYYMALAKGLYQSEGLSVRIRRGGPDVSSRKELVEGRADFAVAMLSTALEQRAHDQSLVLLSQVVNRSNFVLIAWKHPPDTPAATIRQPSDLTGRRISLWEADLRLPYLSYFAAEGIRPRITPQYYEPSLFLQRGVDACAGMHYNELNRLLQRGVLPEDLVVFNLWKQGVVLPEDGIYAREQTWREDPAFCQAFARASLAGWRYAREHQEEALDAVMRHVREDNLPTNRPHMRWMLGEILRSIFPEPGDPWAFGRISPQAYGRAVQILEQHAHVGGASAYDNFVTPEARHVVP